MTQRRFGVSILALAASICASAVAVAPVSGAIAGTGVTRPVASAGSTSFNPTADGSDAGFGQPELGPGTGEASGNVSSHNRNGVNRSRSIEHTAPGVITAPIAPGVGVSSTGPLAVLASFEGLNHRNQRLANGGNQFSLEPPDQGLCAGNGVEMEIINDVMKVYSPTGSTVKATEDLNTFFGYPAQFDRTHGLVG